MTTALELLRDIWSLNHALESRSLRMKKIMGVTAQQRMVLRFIGSHGAITAGALAALLHVGAGTISIALKRLTERGFVARKRDGEDKRRVILVLTAAGKRLDLPTIGTVESAVQHALRGMKKRELEELRAFLQRLAQALDDDSEGAEPRARAK